MKHTLQNICLLIFELVLVISFVSCKTIDTNDDTVLTTQIESTSSFSSDNAINFVKQLKAGWNLGNTLDAIGSFGLNSETSWGMCKTTKAMIDEIKKAGFNTIRIPISYHNHISNGKIDSEWIARIKEIVDWSIKDNGLYVL